MPSESKVGGCAETAAEPSPGSRVNCEDPIVSRGTAHALTCECGPSPGEHRHNSSKTGTKPIYQQEGPKVRIQKTDIVPAPQV
jgi:hypothetical protein